MKATADSPVAFSGRSVPPRLISIVRWRELKWKLKSTTTFIPLLLAYDDLPKGVELIRNPIMERRDADYVAVATGVLMFASGVSASIIAAWIYDKIKNVKDKPEFWMKINEKIVRQIDENSITETIQREIEISKK